MFTVKARLIVSHFRGGKLLKRVLTLCLAFDTLLLLVCSVKDKVWHKLTPSLWVMMTDCSTVDITIQFLAIHSLGCINHRQELGTPRGYKNFGRSPRKLWKMWLSIFLLSLNSSYVWDVRTAGTTLISITKIICVWINAK